MSLLVIDVGTSGLRAAIVRPDASVEHVAYRAFPPDTPFPGLVEFDAAALAAAVLEVAHAALAAGGPVEAVGITNQRASTIVWDRATGVPVGPALGWQDLRTVGTCLELARRASRWPRTSRRRSWPGCSTPSIPSAGRDLCFGTVDTWLAWTLSGGGALHVTDRSNAGVIGPPPRRRLGVGAPRPRRPEHPRDRCCPCSSTPSGVIGEATALPAQPPIAALVGDQQGSLLGQACVRPGPGQDHLRHGRDARRVPRRRAPAAEGRGPHGTFPIVAWTSGRRLTWGAEAIMLPAGTNVDWLVDDLELFASAAESEAVAAACDDTGDVVYVPALLGLGTPHWDYGARSTLLGMTRGTRPPRDRPGRARGHRPPGRRPRRGGGGRHRRHDPDAAGRWRA